MKIKKHTWKLIVLVVVLIIGASTLYSNSISKNADEGVIFQEHIKGNPDAQVVLTEFSDFQCPACAQFSGVVDKILEEYGESVRFEYKHFPLVSIHKNAIPAAKAAEAAGQQGAFFKMHDVLFAKQQEWSDVPNPQLYFVQYAQELGLDVAQFKTQMKSSLIADKVKDELHQAQELGLRGTPTFFLNGEQMKFKTFEDFAGQIAQAIDITKQTEVSDVAKQSTTSSETSEVPFGF